jgi:RNase P/RNase MRP subunit p30
MTMEIYYIIKSELKEIRKASERLMRVYEAGKINAEDAPLLKQSIERIKNILEPIVE